jgi:RNA polymerase sigma factor (sigma-70 family)
VGTSGKDSDGVLPFCLGRKERQKMLFRKTPANQRADYRFHSVTGETFVIKAEDVGEEYVRILHLYDDAIVRNNIKNCRPKVEEWQKPGIELWKKQHEGEEPPKNWNISLDGLEQTEDADHSRYMKEAYEHTTQGCGDPQRDLLREKVEELPEGDRELYRLYFMEGYSQEEVAEEYGVSQNTVSKRLRRIKKVLTDECMKEIKKNLSDGV